MAERDWYHVSSHGAMLFCVAVHPDCTVGDLSRMMSLTRRQTWNTVGALRRAGMLHVRRNGRTHHYTVNLDAPFRHPTIEGCKLRDVLGRLMKLLPQNGDSAL
jgi:hypothetical protein